MLIRFGANKLMINGQSVFTHVAVILIHYPIKLYRSKMLKTPKKTPPKNHSSILGVQKISKHYAKIKLKFETIL